jgi:hypothetical protein
LFVHAPGVIALNVTSITINAFGASDPILASVKPPGDRHPPPTISVSTTLSAVAFPKLPYPIANVMLDPAVTWLLFASLITTRSAA